MCRNCHRFANGTVINYPEPAGIPSFAVVPLALRESRALDLLRWAREHCPEVLAAYEQAIVDALCVPTQFVTGDDGTYSGQDIPPKQFQSVRHI